ncbi:hypothetical protein E3Q18_01449 [Wallemia mellicola]|nr:hypothetical protein E3Q18_01449 [Wallemia mellicola]
MQKRSSIHPSVSRPSVAGPPISSILPAKALELHGLEQVKGATSQLLERVEGLAEEAHTLAEGGEAVGKVLGVWEELFSVIRLMGSITNQQSEQNPENGADDTAEQDGDSPTEKLSTDILLMVVTILFPPAAVAFISGCSCDLLINVGLSLLGYLPGHIHAFWLIFKRMAAEEKYGYKGFRYLGSGKYESIDGLTTEPHQPPPAYGATDNA